MRAEHRILVSGATGNTGSMVLQELAARGARVRAIGRDPRDGRLRGTSAEVVVGDFDDPRSLPSAAFTSTCSRGHRASSIDCRRNPSRNARRTTRSRRSG